MAIYKIPQDVEAEDKLLGPFTFRQFIYLLIVAAFVFVAIALWRILPILAVVPLPIIIFFSALALPLRKDQPMETYLSAILSFYLKPRTRIWDPDGVESRVEITAPTITEASLTKDITGEEAGRRFEYLAQIVDSKGWATRGSIAQGGIHPDLSNNLNPDIYYESQDTVDILDDNYSVGVNIDQRLNQSATQYRQNIMQNISQPIHQEAPVIETIYTNQPAIPQAPMQTNFTPPPVTENTINTLINPYPVFNQAVITPLSEPIAPTIEQTSLQPTETAEPVKKTVSPDIIELATNAPEDLSIATIAKQAKRLSKKAERLGEDEVVISLR